MSDSANFCTVCGQPSAVITLPSTSAATPTSAPLTQENVDPVALWIFIGSILVGWNPALWIGTLIGSIIALKRTSLPGVRGRRLAIAALVIHAVYFLIFVAIVVIIAGIVLGAAHNSRLA